MTWRDWLPRWSFRDFVGTVNTSGLSSVLTSALWLGTGVWTIRAMEWCLAEGDRGLKRVGVLLALLPFHAAWCAYLTTRSVVNLGSKTANRLTDLDYVEKKGEADAKKVAAVALVKNGGTVAAPPAAAEPAPADGPTWAPGVAPDPLAGEL